MDFSQLMEQTIRKDVLEVDQKITELSSRLCNERANLIRQEVSCVKRSSFYYSA